MITEIRRKRQLPQQTNRSVDNRIGDVVDNLHDEITREIECDRWQEDDWTHQADRDQSIDDKAFGPAKTIRVCNLRIRHKTYFNNTRTSRRGGTTLWIALNRPSKLLARRNRQPGRPSRPTLCAMLSRRERTERFEKYCATFRMGLRLQLSPGF